MPMAIRNSDELLKPFFSGLLDRAPIAFVISTTGDNDSQYVRANAAYTRLVGRSWGEIRQANMIAAGTAIASPDRLRRLWKLDRRGAYENEVVEIGHSSGRRILCAISAQRVIFEGAPYDFEYIIELNSGKASSDADFASDSSKTSPPSARTIRPFSPKVSYTDNISRTLAMSSDDVARNLVVDMLSSVSRGILCLGRTVPMNHPIARLAQRHAREVSGQEPNDKAFGLAFIEFQDLTRAAAEERLLALVADIWTLARFQQRDLKAKLLALVTPYTRQPTASTDG